MYPYPPQRAKDDEATMIDVRGVLPGQRPAVDAAVLNEPTSEVPVIALAAPDDQSAAAETSDATEQFATEPQVAADEAADADPYGEPDPAADAVAAEAAEAVEAAGAVEAAEAIGEDADHFPDPTAEAAIETAIGEPDDVHGRLAEADPHPPEDETETLVHSPYAPHQTEPATTPPVVAAFGAPPTSAPPASAAGGSRAPGDVAESRISLWSEESIEQLRGQWRELQGEFIDDPEAAVTSAKSLVTGAVRELADTLLQAQDELDPFQRDDSVDTEAMRVAMRRYREFLDRVLAL